MRLRSGRWRGPFFLWPRSLSDRHRADKRAQRDYREPHEAIRFREWAQTIVLSKREGMNLQGHSSLVKNPPPCLRVGLAARVVPKLL